MVLTYVLRRFLKMVPTFLGAALLAFVIIQAVPGDFTDRFALDQPVIAYNFVGDGLRDALDPKLRK